MKKNYYLVLNFIFSASFLFAQDCSKIRTGTFYYYPARSYVSPADYSIITRHDSIEIEITPMMNDTIYWKIQIENGCIFNRKVIRRSGFVAERTQRLYDSSYYKMEILQVTKDYYTFRGCWESVMDRTTIIDTVWRNPKF
jgi:hypothetical protein